MRGLRGRHVFFISCFLWWLGLPRLNRPCTARIGVGFANVRPGERKAQWQLMKQNFGTRWEGETRWFAFDSADELLPISEPLTSIYQLEFPEATPEVGTWRGWGVLKAGDTRVVPLSEETVLDRQQGASTFQFPGVGGRLTLRNDNGTWGAEVNFFHAQRRSGLCIFYNQEGELGQFMSMAFRSAPISLDGNQSFVESPSFTVADQPDPIDRLSAGARWPDPSASIGRTSKCVALSRAYVFQPQEARSDLYAHQNASYVEVKLPDNVLAYVPRRLSPDSRLSFACDFRGIGGPFRSVTVEFQRGECSEWLCAEHT